MAYQKKPTELGVAWGKKSKAGNSFVTVDIDVSHDQRTATAMAYMLLSGQKISFLGFDNQRYTDGGKSPKMNFQMSEAQWQWMVNTYTKVFHPNEAPKFDYKASQGQQQYVQPQQPAPAPVAPAPVYAPPAAPVAAAPAPTPAPAPVAPPVYQAPQAPATPAVPAWEQPRPVAQPGQVAL